MKCRNALQIYLWTIVNKIDMILNIFGGNGQIPCRSQNVASILSGVKQPKELCGLRELQKPSIYWKAEWYRSRQVRKLRLLVSSFLRYLKKLSQQALSKGYPFFEKDWTTFSYQAVFEMQRLCTVILYQSETSVQLDSFWNNMLSERSG